MSAWSRKRGSGTPALKFRIPKVRPGPEPQEPARLAERLGTPAASPPRPGEGRGFHAVVRRDVGAVRQARPRSAGTLLETRVARWLQRGYVRTVLAAASHGRRLVAGLSLGIVVVSIAIIHLSCIFQARSPQYRNCVIHITVCDSSTPFQHGNIEYAPRCRPRGLIVGRRKQVQVPLHGPHSVRRPTRHPGRDGRSPGPPGQASRSGPRCSAPARGAARPSSRRRSPRSRRPSARGSRGVS